MHNNHSRLRQNSTHPCVRTCVRVCLRAGVRVRVSAVAVHCLVIEKVK